MKYYLVVWNSEGNIVTNKRKLIQADHIVEAQDKFWEWLRIQPIFQHMWQLSFQIIEIE